MSLCPSPQVLTALTYRTVMLFLIIGAFLSWMLTAWARGSDLKLSDPYSFTVTFPLGARAHAHMVGLVCQMARL
eukprot:366436-Chlamydomonas_euryale.AAC.21